MKGYSGGNKLEDEEGYGYVVGRHEIQQDNQNSSPRAQSLSSPVLTAIGNAVSMTHGDIID